jgi:WG containing repeat
VIDPQFDLAFDFSNELALVQVGNGSDAKFGFITEDGTYRIKPIFDKAISFYNKMAPVKYIGRWGLINNSGKYTIHPDYEDIGDCQEGLCAVRTGGKVGFIQIKPEYIER